MDRILAFAMLSSMAIAQMSLADTKPQADAGTLSLPLSQTTSAALPGLPPPPTGKSTVIGGSIRDVDLVRDQLTLKVFGGHSMKILFDARTQVYRDGKKTLLRDLHPEAHASIQTVLDGTKIYALSIHILSQSPDGEYQGQVLSYDPGSGQLTISAAMSRQPIKLRVPPGTPIVQVGQAATSTASSNSSDLTSLVKGALVSVQFASGSNGRGVASQITILATPGSASVFSGSIGYLDLHAKTLVVVDPRDDKSYKISFDPAQFPISRDLHQGTQVIVTATFDGARYVADSIKLKK